MSFSAYYLFSIIFLHILGVTKDCFLEKNKFQFTFTKNLQKYWQQTLALSIIVYSL